MFEPSLNPPETVYCDPAAYPERCADCGNLYPADHFDRHQRCKDCARAEADRILIEKRGALGEAIVGAQKFFEDR